MAEFICRLETSTQIIGLPFREIIIPADGEIESKSAQSPVGFKRVFATCLVRHPERAEIRQMIGAQMDHFSVQDIILSIDSELPESEALRNGAVKSFPAGGKSQYAFIKILRSMKIPKFGLLPFGGEGAATVLQFSGGERGTGKGFHFFPVPVKNLSGDGVGFSGFQAGETAVERNGSVADFRDEMSVVNPFLRDNMQEDVSCNSLVLDFRRNLGDVVAVHDNIMIFGKGNGTQADAKNLPFSRTDKSCQFKLSAGKKNFSSLFPVDINHSPCLNLLYVQKHFFPFGFCRNGKFSAIPCGMPLSGLFEQSLIRQHRLE